MKNTEFVTSINVTDVRTPRDGDVDQVSTTVRGQFMFDGRIRSDQVGRFVTKVAPGELTTHIETNFTVKVVKAKHMQWREMKSCPQKDAIQSELTALAMEHLSGEVDWRMPGEQNENTSENTQENGPEYDVETERALALEEFANTIPSKYAESIPVTTFLGREAELNKAVAAAATAKDSNDLLEIPNFLKRS